MDDSNTLHLLGVSFRAAPVAVRGALSFDRPAAAALLRGVAADQPDLEALVLSTCNRTEFLLAAPGCEDPTESWLARLRRLRPDARVLRDDCRHYRLSDTAAARHLFRVACGLDSAILGDVQILGQVKDAMAVSAEAGTLGPYLTRTVEHAIRGAKRARRETTIGHGAASVGSVLAAMLAGTPPGAILIIGAGEVAQDVGRHLAKRRAGTFVIVNRTMANAEELARGCDGRVRPWEELDDALAHADAVVVATSAPRPIVQRAALDRAVARRSGRRLLVIDAGVPCNVENGSRAEVLDIDAIRERREAALAARRAAIPAVERIVEDEVRQWERWRGWLPLEAVIKTLYRDVAAASSETARRLAAPGALDDTELERIIGRSFKKLLHGHVRNLRGLSVAGVQHARLD
jgi:glutamyl-tRNA reductase